jgi:Flp pilus assembly pilin Flp
MSRVRGLLVDECGQDFVEYGIALAIIALGMETIQSLIGG